MDQEMVDVLGDDPAVAHQTDVLLDPQGHDIAQHRGVLSQIEHPGGMGIGRSGLVLPGGTCLDGVRGCRAGVHANREAMSMGHQMGPVDPERWPVAARPVLDDHGTGSVGEHEAEELGVEGSFVGEATGPESAADHLRAHGHRHPMPIEKDRRFGGPHRSDAGAADTPGGEHLHRPAAESPVHHRRKSGDRQIPLSGAGGQHPDIAGSNPSRLEGGADCGLGEFLVEHLGPAVTIDGVVTLLDPVGVEHPSPQAVRSAALAQICLDLVVADRLARQIAADTGDVCAHDPPLLLVSSGSVTGERAGIGIHPDGS